MKAGYCHAFERAWQFPVFSAYVMTVRRDGSLV